MNCLTENTVQNKNKSLHLCWYYRFWQHTCTCTCSFPSFSLCSYVFTLSIDFGIFFSQVINISYLRSSSVESVTWLFRMIAWIRARLIFRVIATFRHSSPISVARKCMRSSLTGSVVFLIVTGAKTGGGLDSTWYWNSKVFHTGDLLW